MTKNNRMETKETVKTKAMKWERAVFVIRY